MSFSPPSTGRALARGLARKCPHCGEGPIFRRFCEVLEACPVCRLVFGDDPESHIGLMYLTTAIQTALFAILVLNTNPPSPWFARTALVFVALAIMLGNMPNRKGLSIAINYLVDRATREGPEPPRPISGSERSQDLG